MQGVARATRSALEDVGSRSTAAAEPDFPTTSVTGQAVKKTRGRGTKQAGVRQAFAEHSERLRALLMLEFDEEKKLSEERLLSWRAVPLLLPPSSLPNALGGHVTPTPRSLPALRRLRSRARLVKEGVTLFGMRGRLEGELGRDIVVRFKGPGGDPLPFHRFAQGDIVALTEGEQARRERAAPRALWDWVGAAPAREMDASPSPPPDRRR